jgi:hypothetical protein
MSCSWFVESLYRKTSSGDDVMVMTIEFLRARLLSERSASKSAKLQIQQLTKKVGFPNCFERYEGLYSAESTPRCMV